MPLVFEAIFYMDIISWIESIGGGQVGGGWGEQWGQVGSRRRAKESTQTEMAALCHQ